MFYDSLAVEDTLKALQHQFTMTGLLVENDFPGISYTNIGINGAKVESYLACPKLEHELKFFKPDLVIFSIGINDRSEEHTSELQSRPHLVCRLLLEKKKNIINSVLHAANHNHILPIYYTPI